MQGRDWGILRELLPSMVCFILRTQIVIGLKDMDFHHREEYCREEDSKKAKSKKLKAKSLNTIV
jgi:hypothetical protein